MPRAGEDWLTRWDFRFLCSNIIQLIVQLFTPGPNARHESRIGPLIRQPGTGHDF